MGTPPIIDGDASSAEMDPFAELDQAEKSSTEMLEHLQPSIDLLKDLQREVSELKQELKGQSKAWKHTDAPQESSTARDSRVPRATFL